VWRGHAVLGRVSDDGVHGGLAGTEAVASAFDVFRTASGSFALECGEFAIQSTQQSGVGATATVLILTGPDSRRQLVQTTLLAGVRGCLDGIDEVTVRAAEVVLAHV
jgi:hypothetical protein